MHGGYWQKGTKEVSSYCVVPLVERGYKVIVVDYNLCPATPLPVVVAQLRKGMNRILEYAYMSNADKVTICGHSAGAHLVSTLLGIDYKHKNLVKHYILISGVYDLTEIWETKTCSSISGVNNPLGLTAETMKANSPVYYSRFTKHLADFHLIYGKYETPSCHGHAEAFKKVLETHNFKVHQYEFPTYDHFDIAHSMKDEDSPITQYIFKVLGLKIIHKL